LCVRGDITSMSDFNLMTREQLIEEVRVLKAHVADLERSFYEMLRVDESCSQYEFIVNTSREMLSLIDRNYRYVAINNTYCSAHKRERRDIVGSRVADLWGEEVFDSTIRANMDRCLAGEEVHYQAKFNLPAEGLRTFEVTYYPYRDCDARVTHVVVVSRDITEKKAIEHELVALKKAVETMQLGVTISSCEGKILYSNPAEAAMHGYSSGELVGREVSIFATGPAMKQTAKIDFDRIGSWRREGVNVDRYGNSFPVHLMSDVVRNDDGEPISIVTTCENITERKRSELKLKHSRDELMLAYDTTIEGWSRALDYRDKETEGHSRRVTELTVKVAQHMGVGDSDIVHVRRGALLHDIGKLGVPDHILFKPDQLAHEEWQIMKKHPEIAFELLSPISFLRPSIIIPYCHHEKWDGSGYPRGLSREQIPLEARIFSIVDVWDALSNDRYYRPAWPLEKVRTHIMELSGKHFDPEIVQAFLQVVGQEKCI
jgi:PAS domain S-box-containing protein/putative nucleotidyltransferase with HDIG domain